MQHNMNRSELGSTSPKIVAMKLLTILKLRP